MKEPLVSIIIPVYNTGKPATKLINTLLDSPYYNLEIIAVDDGSTDDSLKFLRAIKDPQVTQTLARAPHTAQTTALHRGRNSRLRVLYQKNAGASSARNLGIKHATGRYIAFFDSDDTVDPEIITRFVRAYEAPSKSPSILLATCAYRYHRVRQGTTEDIYTNPPVSPQPDDTFKSYILRLLLADGRLYAVINKLFRADIIQRHHLEFDTSLNFAEDTKFVLAYLGHAYHDVSTHWQDSLTFLSEPLYHYNYGTATSTVASSSLPWQNWQTSYDNLTAWLGSTPTKRELKFLHKVHTRWQISHALAVARANLPLKEKRQYLSLPKLFLAKIALIFRK